MQSYVPTPTNVRFHLHNPKIYMLHYASRCHRGTLSAATSAPRSHSQDLWYYTWKSVFAAPATKKIQKKEEIPPESVENWKCFIPQSWSCFKKHCLPEVRHADLQRTSEAAWNHLASGWKELSPVARCSLLFSPLWQHVEKKCPIKQTECSTQTILLWGNLQNTE